MKNKKFTQTSDSHKTKKLRIALRRHTQNALSDQQLDAIIKNTKINCQYWIQIYSDPEQFCRKLEDEVMASRNFRIAFGQIVIGEPKCGITPVKLEQEELPASAVSQGTSIRKGTTKNRGTIYIYVPAEYKGENIDA